MELDRNSGVVWLERVGVIFARAAKQPNGRTILEDGEVFDLAFVSNAKSETISFRGGETEIYFPVEQQMGKSSARSKDYAILYCPVAHVTLRLRGDYVRVVRFTRVAPPPTLANSKRTKLG